MYFIPRNNAVYNYIAHTDSKRRYFATLFVLAAIVVVCFYFVYTPLKSHIALYKAEKMRLQKQYEESDALNKSSKELSQLLDTSKKNIDQYTIATDQRADHCSKHMQFIFDIITQSGLTLKSYGSCKEKDKKWYVKEISSCQATGTLEKILSFLKAVKDSERMINLSHVNITHIQNNLFQLSCDIGVVMVNQ